MRRFTLVRDEDVSGVSGTGVVAEGVEFTNGKVVVRWLSERASTVVWDTLADAEAIHGHGGKTKVVWLDNTDNTSIVLSGYQRTQKLINALYTIAHYADNGWAGYQGVALLQAAHGLMKIAADALRDVGFESSQYNSLHENRPSLELFERLFYGKWPPTEEEDKKE